MIFRYARHTNHIDSLRRFYVEVIGITELGGFNDHAGYNGVFLGKQGMDWHLEFTESGEPANHVFDEDDILVFYPKTKNEMDQIMGRITANNIPLQTPQNPYWGENGIMVRDPDGYPVIISPLKVEE